MADMKNNFDTVAYNFSEPVDDEKWINFILNYLIVFYNKHKRRAEFQNKSENQITEAIYFWLKQNEKNKKFNRNVVVNLQTRSNNPEIEGYYDFKFEPRKWMENDPHFAVENKLLKNTETSFKEYTYFPNKPKGTKENRTYFDDGGMFRFLSNKYAKEQDFGGMIGFIKKGNIEEIQKNLKNKIIDLKIPNKNNFYGELIDDNLLKMKIQNFDNSLQTNHIRKDGTKIHILHLLFNFDENK